MSRTTRDGTGMRSDAERESEAAGHRTNGLRADMLHESDAPPKARTAVLLDGYPLWLDAVGTVLAGIGVSVVGKTTSPQRALALLDEHSPDLLIADVEVIGDHVRIRWLESALRKRACLKVFVLGHRA